MKMGALVSLLADPTDDVGSWGVKRTHGRHRGSDAIDLKRNTYVAGRPFLLC
jgi:hypothetical protein